MLLLLLGRGLLVTSHWASAATRRPTRFSGLPPYKMDQYLTMHSQQCTVDAHLDFFEDIGEGETDCLEERFSGDLDRRFSGVLLRLDFLDEIGSGDTDCLEERFSGDLDVRFSGVLSRLDFLGEAGSGDTECLEERFSGDFDGRLSVLLCTQQYDTPRASLTTTPPPNHSPPTPQQMSHSNTRPHGNIHNTLPMDTTTTCTPMHLLKHDVT